MALITMILITTMMNEKKQNKIIDVTFILSTLLCFGPMIYGLIMWEKLPEQMPIHFSADGNVDSWGDRWMMEMFRLVQKALDGSCQTVVFVGQLCCDAEMMGTECLEIGGIADEYSLVGGKICFELCRRMRG